MLRSDSPTTSRRRRDRHATMTWLGHQFVGPEFHNETQDGRAALVAWLEHRCRAMRTQGIAGSWHYDLPLHTELCRILKAEQAEIAAMESLPAFPDRQRLRAA
jgi:hypothetical protein